MCIHQPPCPSAGADDWAAARVVAAQRQQGWVLLCNGVVVFDDTGALLPDGTAVDPRRPAASRAAVSRPAPARRDNREVRAPVARIAVAQAAGRALGLCRTPRRAAQRLGFPR